MWIVVAGRKRHFKLDFHKKQGKKILIELDNSYESLIELVRITK
jgi:hypothetical protein